MCFLKSSEQNWVNEAQHAAPHTHINRFVLLFIANIENFVFSNLIFLNFFVALPPVFSDGTDHSDHQHSSHLPNLMSTSFSDSEPEFVEQVPNVTVSVGRDAKFPCKVNKLDTYRVSFIFSVPRTGDSFCIFFCFWALFDSSDLLLGKKDCPFFFLCVRSINVRLIDTIETLYTCTHILSHSWNIFCFFFPFPPLLFTFACVPCSVVVQHLCLCKTEEKGKKIERETNGTIWRHETEENKIAVCASLSVC